jgi:hypothetical protein
MIKSLGLLKRKRSGQVKGIYYSSRNIRNVLPSLFSGQTEGVVLKKFYIAIVDYLPVTQDEIATEKGDWLEVTKWNVSGHAIVVNRRSTTTGIVPISVIGLD